MQNKLVGVTCSLPGTPTEIVSISPADREGGSIPRTAFLEILYGCNLRCTYCYIGEDRNHRDPLVPPIDTTVRILQSLKRDGIDEVILLGGEPTLHPHFASICSAIADLSFAHRGVVSNGYGISADVVAVLKANGFWVDLTFRGSTESTFDSLAGKAGAFAKAVKAAHLIADGGVPLGIEFDCAKANYPELFDVVNNLMHQGIPLKQVQLHRVLPEGDAVRCGIDNFTLDLSQWHEVFEQAGRIEDILNVPVIFEDGFPLCLLQERHRRHVTPCACGFTLVTISPTGDVRACSCAATSYGNLLIEPLSLIWSNSLASFRQLRGLPAACLSCDLLQRCRGGCSSSDRDPSTKLHDFFADELRSVKCPDGDGREPRFIRNQTLVIDECRR